MKQSSSSKQNDDIDAKAVINKAKVEDDEYKTDEQTYYRYGIMISGFSLYLLIGFATVFKKKII